MAPLACLLAVVGQAYICRTRTYATYAPPAYVAPAACAPSYAPSVLLVGIPVASLGVKYHYSTGISAVVPAPAAPSYPAGYGMAAPAAYPPPPQYPASPPPQYPPQATPQYPPQATPQAPAPVALPAPAKNPPIPAKNPPQATPQSAFASDGIWGGDAPAPLIGAAPPPPVKQPPPPAYGPDAPGYPGTAGDDPVVTGTIMSGCTSCHGPGDIKNGVQLLGAAGEPYTAGTWEAEASRRRKIYRAVAHAPGASPMPKNAASLPAATVDAFRRWFLAYASGDN